MSAACRTGYEKSPRRSFDRASECSRLVSSGNWSLLYISSTPKAPQLSAIKVCSQQKPLLSIASFEISTPLKPPCSKSTSILRALRPGSNQHINLANDSQRPQDHIPKIDRIWSIFLDPILLQAKSQRFPSPSFLVGQRLAAQSTHGGRRSRKTDWFGVPHRSAVVPIRARRPGNFPSAGRLLVGCRRKSLFLGLKRAGWW